MELKFDSNLTFREVIIKALALKPQYQGVLASFSYKKLPQRIKKISAFRDLVYSLNFDENRKNKLWEYLNDDLPFEILISLVRR